MGKRKMLGTLAVAITIVVLIIVAALLRIDNWSRDFAENSAAIEADYPDPVAMLDSRLQRWVADKSRWDIQSKTESDGTIEYKITRTTALFRFVDDIEVKLVPDDSGTNTRMHASSQSRVGKGDLGQNPRNLAELVNGLRVPHE
ncbi:putative secreted protein [Rhodopirellula maiorica SM1]|uniref:Putative secreted protein n=1 Tax=Rhodopirellula maiorica SM1 TaxID=1265738 RepID=M5R9F5_9BACT|nr:DUF1499 domain-containing protein [Rhodopirellula maiorica]EMI15681.1 putative secreted protein [Rhodopirellula maiorica SM1]